MIRGFALVLMGCASSSAPSTPDSGQTVPVVASVAPVAPVESAAPVASVASDPADAAAPLADAGAESADALSIARGACFGNCRESFVKLTAAGALTGKGKPRTLPPEQTAALFALAARAFDPAPRCPQLPTDIQRTTVTWKHGGQRSAATFIGSGKTCSALLGELQVKLDAL